MTQQKLTITNILLLGLALGACSSSKKKDTPATVPKTDGADALPVTVPTSTTPASPLLGTWDSSPACIALTSGSAKDLLVLQDGTAIAARTYYSDAKCTTMTYTSTLQGKYLVGDANPSGGTNLDLLYSQQTATYPSHEATLKALTGFTAGTNAICTGGVEPAVSGSLIDLTACIKDPASIFQYTVYTVVGGELHLALPSSDEATNGKAATSRATKLDGGSVYVKP